MVCPGARGTAAVQGMLPSRDAAGGMLPSRALAAAPDGPLRNATGTGGANTNRMPVNPDNAPCGIRGLSRTGDTMDTMRQRILVVDDDPSLAEMLTIVLRGEGFDTAVIGDGTQALTAAAGYSRRIRMPLGSALLSCTPPITATASIADISLRVKRCWSSRPAAPKDRK